MSPSPIAIDRRPITILDIIDPIIYYNNLLNRSNNLVLLDQDFKYLYDFNKKVSKDRLETYMRNKERQFNIKLKYNIYIKYRTTRDKNKKDNKPFLLSTKNLIDPRLILNLLALLQVKQILIAKVYVVIEIY